MPPASNNPQNPGSPSTPLQSIPLRDLTRPPDSADLGDGAAQHARGRNLFSSGSRPSGGQNNGLRYERLGQSSPSPSQRPSNRPQLSRLQTGPAREELHTPLTPGANFGDLQVAMGFAGLRVPDISISQPPQELPTSYGAEDFDPGTRYYDGSGDDNHAEFDTEADDTPLTDPKHIQPVSGSPFDTDGRRYARASFHNVNFNLPEMQPRASRLGDDLESPDMRASSSPTNDGRLRSRSPSTATALSRAGTIVRAMSQRVVNLSGETEVIEESARREASFQTARRASQRSRPSRPTSIEEDGQSDISSLVEESEPQYQHKTDPLGPGPNYQGKPTTPQAEKGSQFFVGGHPENEWTPTGSRPPNPLKGKSLGIFSPDNRIRNLLCDVLVYPFTESAILLLIVVQTILLAVSGSINAYSPANEQQSGWSSMPIDLALLGLFIIFTFEIAARIIVSGFIINAPEYTSDHGKRSLWDVVIDNYHAIFAPQRRASLRSSRVAASFTAPPILRSFTVKHPGGYQSVEQAQRLQLARRAFLRHSFNRLDFIAVVSF